MSCLSSNATSDSGHGGGTPDDDDVGGFELKRCGMIGLESFTVTSVVHGGVRLADLNMFCLRETMLS